MTTALPPDLRRVADYLRDTAGSFLDSTIHETGATCVVCRAPTAGYRMCFQCQTLAKQGIAVADRVGTMVYAVEPGSQAYRIVRDYKGSRPGPSHRPIMSALLALGPRGHTRCAGALAGVPVDAWSVVPSTRGRMVFHDIAGRLARSQATDVPVAFTGTPGEREFASHHWAVDASTVPRHVLVVDDSWVTGAHAQSVAATLKCIGVEQVSILAVARILDPKWRPNRTLIQEHLRGGTFDCPRCPWTGGDCPG